MRVFTCDDFKGYWPVGTAAVIVAESKADAEKRLREHLASMGLRQDDRELTLIELDTHVPYVCVLRDGNY